MKSTVSVFLRICLALLFCLATFASANPTSAAAGDKDSRKKCEKKCDKTYKDRNHSCKQLRKLERKPCQEAAKEARNICKFRCK